MTTLLAQEQGSLPPRSTGSPGRRTWPLALAAGLVLFAAHELLAQSADVRCATAARHDGTSQLTGPAPAILLNGIASDFVFDPPASFITGPGGTARLTGVAVSESKPGQRWIVEVGFTGRLDPGDPAHPPVGSPKQELHPSVYTDQGGPIDPASWQYFPEFTGTLTGLDEFAGAVLRVDRMGPAFQVGVGANGKNLRPGGSGWLTATTLAQPNQGPALPAATVGDMNFDLDDCTYCADPAELDGSGASNGGHALWLPGIGTDFVFDQAGQFVEHADGTARLTGIASRAGNPSKSFVVDIALSGRIDPGAAQYPPSGSPKLELADAAYLANGGTIDPDIWHYYQVTDGTLIGRLDYKGAVLHVTHMGPAFQVGHGASGKNLNYGGSGWLTVTTQKQPKNGPNFPSSLTGDVNIDVGADCRMCVEEASGAGHAVWLPGIATDLVPDGAGLFVERSDGTARFVARVQRTSDGGDGFMIDVEFGDLVMPGDASYPPSGSPKKELPSSSYLENGGPIATSSWRYYETFSGVMTGFGDYTGAVLEFTRMGPSFQVGRGANGKNLNYGGSCWMTVDVVHEPNGGTNWPASLTGDLNLDFGTECIEDGIPATYGGGCPGTGGHVPELLLLGVLEPWEHVTLVLRKGLPGGQAWLVAGTERASGTLLLGCNLLVAPYIAFVGPLPLAGSGPGAGEIALHAKLPKTLPPVTITLQGLILDPGAPIGLAATNAVEMDLH